MGAELLAVPGKTHQDRFSEERNFVCQMLLMTSLVIQSRQLTCTRKSHYEDAAQQNIFLIAIATVSWRTARSSRTRLFQLRSVSFRFRHHECATSDSLQPI